MGFRISVYNEHCAPNERRWWCQTVAFSYQHLIETDQNCTPPSAPESIRTKIEGTIFVAFPAAANKLREILNEIESTLETDLAQEV